MPATESTTQPDPLCELLADHDAPCPNCGYNLRGIARPRCPECDHPVTFDNLVEKKHAATLPWVIALIAYAAALPWSVLYVWQRLIIRRVLYYGRPTYTQSAPHIWINYPHAAFDNVWCVLSYGYWLSVPLVVVLLALARRLFIRLPIWLQWLVALAALGLTLLAFRRWQWSYWHLLNQPRLGFWDSSFWWLHP